MQTIDFEQSADRKTEAAIASKSMLCEMGIVPPIRHLSQREREPEEFAMRGLILVAVPVSLCLWLGIVLLIRAIMH